MLFRGDAWPRLFLQTGDNLRQWSLILTHLLRPQRPSTVPASTVRRCSLWPLFSKLLVGKLQVNMILVVRTIGRTGGGGIAARERDLGAV
jgi:hypothetical protein